MTGRNNSISDNDVTNYNRFKKFRKHKALRWHAISKGNQQSSNGNDNVKTFASINISNLIEPQEKPLLISEVYYLDIPTTQKPDKKYTTN